jgi:hypothetical protein
VTAPICPAHKKPGRYAWGSMVVCDDCYAPPTSKDDGAAPLPARTALRDNVDDAEETWPGSPYGCQVIDLGFDFSDVRQS